MTATQAALNSYPLVHRHGQRRVRIVRDGEVATDRLLYLPLPEYVIRLIATLIHEEGKRRGHIDYREGFGRPIKPLDWYLD